MYVHTPGTKLRIVTLSEGQGYLHSPVYSCDTATGSARFAPVFSASTDDLAEHKE